MKKTRALLIAVSFLPALALAQNSPTPVQAAAPAPVQAAPAQPASDAQRQAIQQDKSAIKQLQALNEALGSQVQQGVQAANDAQRQEMIQTLQTITKGNNKELMKAMKDVNGKYNVVREGVVAKAAGQRDINDLQIKTDKKDIRTQKQIIRANGGGLLNEIKAAGSKLLGKIKAADEKLFGRSASTGGATGNMSMGGMMGGGMGMMGGGMGMGN